MVQVKKATALAYVHGRAGGVVRVDRTDKMQVMGSHFGKDIKSSYRVLTSDEGTDRKGKGAHWRPWSRGAGLICGALRCLQVLNTESTEEGEAGVKIHREVELRSPGDDGQVVAEGRETNRGRDGRT